ncbi:hypothetical protein VFPBJ_03904 [Purpureocillium lilacinum]|uniref:Uncharacterized protein n=1 Tax=Purpureocillium lilacinum TaxID=33203 RepID=A0A179H6D6_PURLI|nr:hypothetical protein VFPBJ_03904 [Purpureocillium lilacinum]
MSPRRCFGLEMDLDFGRRGRGSAAGLAELTDRWTSEVIAGPTEAPAGVGSLYSGLWSGRVRRGRAHTSAVTNVTYSRRIEIPGRLGATAASGFGLSAHRRPLEIVEALGQIDHHLPASLANSRRQQRKLVACRDCIRGGVEVLEDAVKVNEDGHGLSYTNDSKRTRPSIQTSVRINSQQNSMPTLHCQCHGRGAALSYKTTRRAQHRRQGTPNLSREKNRIERQRTPFRPWPAILLHFHLSTRWLKHKALRQAPVGAAAVNAERGGLGTTAVADPPPQESLAGCPSRHHAKLSTPFGNNYVGRTWRRVMPRAITSLHRLGPFRPSRIFPPPQRVCRAT